MRRARRAEFLEIGEVLTSDETERLESQREFPALAEEQGARAQFARRTRQRKRLEAARGGVVVEVNPAHFFGRLPTAECRVPSAECRVPSLSLGGSVSTTFLRSSDFSIVVTSVTPLRATTTRSLTPYSTTLVS